MTVVVEVEAPTRLVPWLGAGTDVSHGGSSSMPMVPEPVARISAQELPLRPPATRDIVELP